MNKFNSCLKFRSSLLKLNHVANRAFNKNFNPAFNKLGVAFNQKPTHLNESPVSKTNRFNKFMPLILNKDRSTFLSDSTASTSGLFGIKELYVHQGFFLLKDKAERCVNDLLDEAFNKTTKRQGPRRKLVQIFDDISNELCRVADLAELVRSTHPDAEFRESADQTFGYISQIVEKLNTNFELYAKLKHETENADKIKDVDLDDCDIRVSKLYLLDFEQSGIHLDEKTRNKFVHVNDDLINILMKFQINSQMPSLLNTQDIDPKFNELVKYYKNPVKIESMFINSEDELLREFIYRSFLKKNPQQENYFKEIIQKRKQLANLCGFKSYAHRSNVSMIMETPENVMNFLDNLSDSIKDKAALDFEMLKKYKRAKLKSTEPLMQWDLPFLCNLVKKDKYDIDSYYTNYFSLGSCMEGLNMILNNVFKVNLEMAKVNSGEIWHEDIYKLIVKDEKNNTLGYIYCDFYQRENKFSNVDCHFTVQCSKLLENDTYQLPIVVLHLNFPSPTKERPTLLTFEMMENLFHEFGHAMHSMFAKTRYQHVSGTRCSTDFAEVPSQLFEYFVREPNILKMFAKHYSTGETLDERIIHKLCESKRLFAACDLQSQILHSALDQAFHMSDLTSLLNDPTDLIREYTRKYYSLPYVDNTHWHLRFSHLVGYGAKYYSYLVSKSIASKIWTECFEKNPLSSTAGENYRFKLLAFGGEKRPKELISSLIGLEVENSSLINSLTKHL